MRARSAEPEPFDKSPLREHLARSAYDFCQAYVLGVDSNKVCAACDPDVGLVLVGL